MESPWVQKSHSSTKKSNMSGVLTLRSSYVRMAKPQWMRMTIRKNTSSIYHTIPSGNEYHSKNGPVFVVVDFTIFYLFKIGWCSVAMLVYQTVWISLDLLPRFFFGLTLVPNSSPHRPINVHSKSFQIFNWMDQWRINDGWMMDEWWMTHDWWITHLILDHLSLRLLQIVVLPESQSSCEQSPVLKKNSCGPPMFEEIRNSIQ